MEWLVGHRLPFCMAARKGGWDSGHPGIIVECGLFAFLVVAHGRGRERGKSQGNLQRMFWRKRQGDMEDVSVYLLL